MSQKKKILFIATTYFGYHQQIMQEIQRQGVDVQFFHDDPLQSYSLHHLRHRLPAKLIGVLSRSYKKKVLQHIQENQYDGLLVIRGEFVDQDVLDAFRKKNPGTECIMYQWDSLRNFDFRNNARSFNKVFSFDPVDCKANNFIYLPLFALDEFFTLRERKKHHTPSIDLLFVGYNHGGRIAVTRLFKERFAGTGTNVCAFLYTPFPMFFRNMLTGFKKFRFNEATVKKISRPRFKELLVDSRIMLDVQSPTQSGLTMRTFEVLASGCHLLTTNTSILQEPFYDERYITVFREEDVKREDFRLPATTTEAPLEFSRYALSSWVRTLISSISNK